MPFSLSDFSRTIIFSPFTLFSQKEQLEILQQEYALLAREISTDAKRAAKLESKINASLTSPSGNGPPGLKQTTKQLRSSLADTFAQIDRSSIDFESFQALEDQEALALTSRVGELRRAVEQQKQHEQDLQARYGKLLKEKEMVDSILSPS